MGVYEIIGGRPLRGAITIHGAKNSVLPILAATLVHAGYYSIHNCPHISDVSAAVKILRSLGCGVVREDDVIHIDSRSADRTEISPELMGSMRAAVIFLGALLARFGEATLSHPGGCFLGERPIDLHLRGLEQMGCCCIREGERLFCRAERLHGCTVSLTFPSVGATENLLLAALACDGEVTICNAAREPEIGDLLAFLRTCGAKIAGDGTSVLTVRGGVPLHGGDYAVMPDRMEAVTYLAAGAASGGQLCLKRVCPRHISAVVEVLRCSGCVLRENGGEVRLTAGRLQAVRPIRTAPYPGFPTDALAPLMAVMALARGATVFEERVFPDRFRHIPALQAMGAKIYAARRYAVTEGVERLHGARVEATDLRGGAAMVIAALCAEGKSTITATEHMERGYADFVETLQSCGGQIAEKEGQ